MTINPKLPITGEILRQLSLDYLSFVFILHYYFDFLSKKTIIIVIIIMFHIIYKYYIVQLPLTSLLQRAASIYADCAVLWCCCGVT